MIRRLYVDNYKSLVDFEWKPMTETLVLGFNGSGKTAAIDAIDLIRHWVCGLGAVDEKLHGDKLTRWQISNLFRFEIDIEIDDALYEYRVQFECDKKSRIPAMLTEFLVRDGKTLIARDHGLVAFYSDFSPPVAAFPLPPSQSAVAALYIGQGSVEISPFVTYLQRSIIVRPIPRLILNEARIRDFKPTTYFENFVGWFWQQMGDGRFSTIISDLLRQVWADLSFLRLEPIGKAVALSVVFTRSDRTYGDLSIDFEELSDGERMLVVLYCLVAYQRITGPMFVIIDEPDNFLSLQEIQPWILQMLEDRPDDGQLILVSHNSEIVDLMGSKRISYFDRQGHDSATKVHLITEDGGDLPISELMARGWILNDAEEPPVHE